MIKKFKKLISDVRGFSIVEMLTTTLIFSMLAITVGGILVESLRIQRKSFAAQNIQENVLFMLESMARDIRVSQIISNMDNSDCSRTRLDIIHPTQGTIIYYVNANGIVYRQLEGEFEAEISSSDLIFKKMNFCVLGSADIDDTIQTRVTIITTVADKSEPNQEINVQTTVTARYVEM